jgi:hypothetical protein
MATKYRPILFRTIKSRFFSVTLSSPSSHLAGRTRNIPFKRPLSSFQRKRKPVIARGQSASYPKARNFSKNIVFPARRYISSLPDAIVDPFEKKNHILALKYPPHCLSTFVVVSQDSSTLSALSHGRSHAV